MQNTSDPSMPGREDNDTPGNKKTARRTKLRWAVFAIYIVVTRQAALRLSDQLRRSLISSQTLATNSSRPDSVVLPERSRMEMLPASASLAPRTSM